MLGPTVERRTVVLSRDVWLEMMGRFGYWTDEKSRTLAGDTFSAVTGMVKPMHRGFYQGPSTPRLMEHWQHKALIYCIHNLTKEVSTKFEVYPEALLHNRKAEIDAYTKKWQMSNQKELAKFITLLRPLRDSHTSFKRSEYSRTASHD